MRALALLPFVLLSLYRLSQGEVRWDYVAFLVVPPFLAYANTSTKKLFDGLYPLGIVAVLYDAMRFVQNVGVTPARVHVCDLRELEVRFFGIDVGGERMTVHDWLQSHATPLLDLYFAIPYATFAFSYIGFAVFLWTRDYRALQRFAWCFLVLNLAGFVTYHLYPAAPPWYFHAHGCSVDMTAQANEGANLARVDQWLGIGYFHGLYGRASDVYGAVPSLHVAYPLVIMLEGWPFLRRTGRVISVVFFVSMCAGAVYLDHHWLIDVVVGLVYGFASVALVRAWFSVRPLTSGESFGPS